MKRIICIGLAMLILLTVAVPTMAAVSEPPVSPQYTYIRNIYSGLSINETTGKASCHASTYAVGGNSIKLMCRLQRYNGSTWSTIYTWSTTASQSVALNKTYTVSSGYTYRVRATCYVYNSAGTIIESGNCYSNYVVY